MGLASGEIEHDEKKDDVVRLITGEMPNFNINTDIFQQSISAYQEMDSLSNSKVEQLIGVVHTEASNPNAKAALKTITEDSKDEYVVLFMTILILKMMKSKLTCWRYLA